MAARPIQRDPLLTTPRTQLYVAHPDLAQALLEFYRANDAHLRHWEPARPPEAQYPHYWIDQTRLAWAEFESGTSVRLLVVDPETDQVIGTCNLTNISHGAFQACHLGYAIAAAQEGRGIMSEIVECVVAYAFDTLGLHRVMANYMPENTRSAALLERLGFEREGHARAYLKINGEWRDHVLTARVNPTDST